MQDKTTAKSQIEKLVHYFEQNIHQLKAPSFNEARARQTLIDPFFEALGWDVRNRQMRPPHQWEVIPEGRVKSTAGTTVPEYVADDEYKAEQRMATKKPDYRFRLQGSTKFFVEAKKPFVDVMKNEDAIFQIKRYGFSARVPVSILTDFEEFRVFDCTRRPFYDKPKIGAIKEFDLGYKSYLNEFDKVYDTFSREAVIAGSIEAVQKKYLEKKTGEFALDREFLEDLSDWRLELAKDIAKHPKNRRFLNEFTLKECVQRILDRIVFLRVCEDRGIEVSGTLLAILRLWQDHPALSLYDQFNKLIDQRRSLYNGLLFAQHECEELVVGDKILETIFKNVNYPESPYHFDGVGVEILGSIYERFLGQTIRLTPKQVRVEDKPEVRKAGGVYYTPQYIVNYIVDNTVEKLIERKTPRQIEKIKIIDIACGSGSFLLGAFQKLIDHHVQYFTEHPTEIKEKHGVLDAYEDAQGRLVLSARKKQEILVNNIYGVDIDQQAVEVTQMSLYLRVLENENDATLNKQTMLALHEVLLPPLKDNIKCGNSLIGTDFASQGALFDDGMRQRVNPFDWEMEFAQVMKNGGFDAVIGNPPYVRQEMLGDLKDYFKTQYKVYDGTADLYVYFFERAHRLLNRSGYFGMICSNKFMRSSYGKGLRDFLRTRGKLIEIVDFGELPVFDGPATFPAIFLTRNEQVREQNFIYAPIKRLTFTSLRSEVESVGKQLTSRPLRGESWTLASDREVAVLEKLTQSGVTLEKYTNGKVYFGIKTGLNDAFVIDDSTHRRLIKEDPKCKSLIRPFVVGDDVRKYQINPKNRFLILLPNGWTRQHCGNSKNPWSWVQRNYPSIAKHLKPFAQDAEKRGDKGEFWWELRPCDYYDELEKPKILYPDIAKESRFTFDVDGLYLANTIYFIPRNDLYLLGILNSKLIFSYFKRFAAVLGDADKGGRLRWFRQDVLRLPIRTIDFDNSSEKEMHGQVVALVDEMLELHKQLNKASFDSEKEPIQRQIAATDKKIDELVYKLYGLTEEEIDIVEGKKD